MVDLGLGFKVEKVEIGMFGRRGGVAGGGEGGACRAPASDDRRWIGGDGGDGGEQ